MFAAWTMGCTHGSGLCVGPCQALYVKGQPVEESVGFLRRPRRRPRPGRPAPHSAGKLGDMQHHRLPDHRATDVVRLVEEHRRLAVGETVILLHPPLPSVGVPIGMERGCQQNDRTLADGYRHPFEELPPAQLSRRALVPAAAGLKAGTFRGDQAQSMRTDTCYVLHHNLR